MAVMNRIPCKHDMSSTDPGVVDSNFFVFVMAEKQRRVREACEVSDFSSRKSWKVATTTVAHKTPNNALRKTSLKNASWNLD